MAVLTRQGLMLVDKNNGSAHPSGFDVGGQKIMEVLTRQNLVDKNNSNELSHAFLTGTGGEKL